MSKRELVAAYLRGQIDRRDFVRRLSVLGVSAGAALAYAQSLAPTATATPGRSASGFVVRAQEADDEDYGTACTFADDLEAIQAALDAVLGVQEILAALDDFSPGDFDSGVYDALSTIRDQQAEHFDALSTIVADLGGAVGGPGSAQSYDSVDDFLATLADALNDLVYRYVGIAPALADGEVRQTVMTIATVVGRHAAYVNQLVGDSPFPDSFDPPLCP